MKAACVQCRVRKVRCDGTVPRCRTCERLSFQCSFEQDGSGGQYAPRIPPKCRGTKACHECRAMKVRCSGDTPQCTNCQRRNKQCTYASKAGSSPTEASSSRDDSASASASRTTVSPEIQRSSIASSSQSNILSSTVDQYTPSLSDELVIGLVSLYFDRLYPLPSYSFLHQATVIQRCRDKSIDHALELAICSITAIHFDDYQYDRDDWAQEAERLILERLEHPSIFKIQASLLLIRYRAAVGQFPRAFIMAGLAARWAAALRLNYEHSKLSPVAQEVRRRTFWSLYLLEDSFCVGLKEFELFDPDVIYLQLPCEDEDFYQERHVATGYLQPGKGLEPEVLGSRAAFVRLSSIRRAIIRLNRRISLKEINISEVFSSMERFQNDLLRLKTKLAPHDQYPLSSRGNAYLSPQYVIMHMSWHQCHCDIYRMFLTEYPESTPHASIECISVSEKASMKEKCISHAEEIVNILSAFVKHKDEKDTLEFDAAICAYHSARLLLFGAYTGGNNTGLLMQTAISKAQSCLDVITRYFDFSAQLKSMRQELERVIQQHKQWLESSDPGAVTTADQASSSKLSKDAYNRQRLAIHSLLRQSDFVDDSRDAAPEPPPEPAYGGGLDLNAWACGTPGTQDLIGYLEDVDEQYMY
ncbi:Ff.00g061310.m01.CDS01 [Fusarium sp. VM40]|nr:Ff.00g061310.m01.CDS01 [Fusarium sp. VM40]